MEIYKLSASLSLHTDDYGKYNLRITVYSHKFLGKTFLTYDTLIRQRDRDETNSEFFTRCINTLKSFPDKEMEDMARNMFVKYLRYAKGKTEGKEELLAMIKSLKVKFEVKA